jgi:hypothetical protein
METLPLIRLDLRAPLFYAVSPGLEPFAYHAEADGPAELIFCFELNPAQSRGIEPDRDNFLGEMVFAGHSTEMREGADTARLPAGLYLLAQKREALGRDDCIALAIEQQKDGLWERLKPENLLYVRYLFEDGSAVTQLFRPVAR